MEPRFVATQFRLGPGDTLVLYTDGLTEARVGSGPERYDFHGALLEFAAEHAPATASAIVVAIQSLLDGFGSGLEDDVAVLALGRTSAMKFVLAAYGSRGDVEPCAVVGRELQRRGHDVRIAVPPNLLALVESVGPRRGRPTDPTRTRSWTRRRIFFSRQRGQSVRRPARGRGTSQPRSGWTKARHWHRSQTVPT